MVMKKVKGGFKNYSKKTGKALSKKSMSKRKAVRQLAAVEISKKLRKGLSYGKQ